MFAIIASWSKYIKIGIMGINLLLTNECSVVFAGECIRHSRSFWDRVGYDFFFHVGLTDSVMQRMQLFFPVSVCSTFFYQRIARFII
jgi:hypothetical protein